MTSNVIHADVKNPKGQNVGCIKLNLYEHLKFSFYLFRICTGNSLIVNSSTWTGLGTLVSLAGPTGTFQGAPPNTALQLTSTTGNANGFNFTDHPSSSDLQHIFRGLHRMAGLKDQWILF